MTTTDSLCRHFSRMGARLKWQQPDARQWEKVRIDVGRDRDGEFYEIRCLAGILPEVLEVRPALHHLVMMVRDGRAKYKYLLGRDDGHWFAAAVPGDSVRDVRSAMASLLPAEVEGRAYTRQGEWFFVWVRDVPPDALYFRHEPLSRGAGSKPHLCAELMRRGGATVMVSTAHPNGIDAAEYQRLIATDPDAWRLNWRQMVRDAEVFARGDVRHRDHKTIHLDGWHRVYMNRERFAAHARQIAFLD
ncbi:MAG: hypothetical protein J0H49_35675 [Acidobacteria bacterium]|nr:hypothetical protein [Acidobacteriota bacterium]